MRNRSSSLRSISCTAPISPSGIRSMQTSSQSPTGLLDHVKWFLTSSPQQSAHPRQRPCHHRAPRPYRTERDHPHRTSRQGCSVPQGWHRVHEARLNWRRLLDRGGSHHIARRHDWQGHYDRCRVGGDEEHPPVQRCMGGSGSSHPRCG